MAAETVILTQLQSQRRAPLKAGANVLSPNSWRVGNELSNVHGSFGRLGLGRQEERPRAATVWPSRRWWPSHIVCVTVWGGSQIEAPFFSHAAYAPSAAPRSRKPTWLDPLAAQAQPNSKRRVLSIVVVVVV